MSNPATHLLATKALSFVVANLTTITQTLGLLG